MHFAECPAEGECGFRSSVTGYVERYLERTFYNLTAVALHDCHTYTEMRLLGDHKYGLILCESRLPFQTLDQGLDVLVVTRNIDSFVSTYNYNLNGQVWSFFFSYPILSLFFCHSFSSFYSLLSVVIDPLMNPEVLGP